MINKYYNDINNLFGKYRDEIGTILNIHNKYKVLSGEEFEDIKELPLWHHIMIVNEEELIDIKNKILDVKNIKSYLFKSYDPSSGSDGLLYLYDYRTKTSVNAYVSDNILLMKKIKLSKRKIFERLLSNINDGKIKINSN